MTGWTLTDDPTERDKWTFPSGVGPLLAAGDYLVVFASGAVHPNLLVTSTPTSNCTLMALSIHQLAEMLPGVTVDTCHPMVEIGQMINRDGLPV